MLEEQLNEELIGAAEQANLELVKQVIQRGANVNYANRHLINALIAASKNGHEEMVKYLIENGARINVLYSSGGDFEINHRVSAFAVAAKYGHLDIVKYMVETAKTDIHATEYSDGKSALEVAAECGHFDLVRYLIEAGEVIADNRSHQNEQSAFAAAAKYGRLEIVKYMVETVRADLDVKYDFVFAAKCGHFEIVKYLIETFEVDVNGEDFSGKTALMYAAAHGELEIVQCLISKGADIDKIDSSGQTALSEAIGGRHKSVAEFLIAYEIKLKDSDTQKPGCLVEQSDDAFIREMSEYWNTHQKVKRDGILNLGLGYIVPLLSPGHSPNPSHYKVLGYLSDKDIRNLGLATIPGEWYGYVNELTEEKKQLEKLQQTSNKEIEKLKKIKVYFAGKLYDANRKVAYLEHERDVIKRELVKKTKLEEDLKQAERNASTLNGKVDELTKKNTQLEDTLKITTEKNAQLQSELESIRKTLDEKDSEVTQLTQENNKPKNDLKQRTTENNDLKTKLQESESKSKGLESRVENLQRQLESKNKELNGKNEEFSGVSTSGKRQGNYASVSFLLSGALAVGASLAIPYLAICISLAVAALTFLTVGCYCLYKANTALSNVGVDNCVNPAVMEV